MRGEKVANAISTRPEPGNSSRDGRHPPPVRLARRDSFSAAKSAGAHRDLRGAGSLPRGRREAVWCHSMQPTWRTSYSTTIIVGSALFKPVSKTLLRRAAWRRSSPRAPPPRSCIPRSGSVGSGAHQPEHVQLQLALMPQSTPVPLQPHQTSFLSLLQRRSRCSWSC